MTVGAFIVARLSSSRLPAKAMMKILDRPMIELMVERVQAARLLDHVVITTSTDPSDDPLERLAEKLGIGCYRGSLSVVMERIAGSARAFDCDIIVELLGDNPLVSHDLIDAVIKLYLDGKYEYAATLTNEYSVPDQSKQRFSTGIRVQAYARSAAERFTEYPDYINNNDKHPCSYIFDHPETFRVGYLEACNEWSFMNRPALNFAVNYRKNFDLIRTFFETHYRDDPKFSLRKVYDQLDAEKHLYLQMGGE